MKKIFIIIFISTMMLGLGACSNSDDNTSTPANNNSPTKTELLTAKPWKKVAETVSPAQNIGGRMVTDLYAEEEACNNDDLYIFNTDKTFKYDEGATKCDPSDPQIWATGTWVFNSDETQMIVTFSGSGLKSTNNILEVSSTTAKLSHEETINGTKYTTTSTYTAQ